MKQHKSTSNDNKLLSEMYGQVGGMTIQSTGNAEGAADQLAQDDGFGSPEEAEEAGFNRKQLDASIAAIINQIKTPTTRTKFSILNYNLLNL